MTNGTSTPALTKTRLGGVFALVVVVASLVIWLNLGAYQSVTRTSGQLVGEHVPELRLIGDLQQLMHKQALQLYLYYATLEVEEYRRQQAMQNGFAEVMRTFCKFGVPESDLAQLNRDIADFHEASASFHDEMSKGADRDWDVLRDHLAQAQLHADAANSRLGRFSENIRGRTEVGARQVMAEVAQMNQLHLGFSAAVLIFSALVMVTWHKRMRDRAQIYHDAFHDRLTGLPNRRALEQAWRETARSPLVQERALLYVGLDQLQLVTGTFGHIIGDQLILRVTHWLQEKIGGLQQDAVIYGLAPGVWLVDMPVADGPESSLSTAEQLLGIADVPMGIDVRELSTTCSIGITFFPNDATRIGDLLRNADAALRHAQGAGGNSLRIYSTEMNREDERRISVESALRKALTDNEFELHFQPKVDASNNEVSGVEALIRWRLDGELVPPGLFIPIAEQSTLIVQIGDWVLNNACRQWAEWSQAGFELPVAVNISAQQFQEAHFPERVIAALKVAGMPASMLELEITEEVASQNPADVVATMERLKQIGVRLSLDDFGTGYSSLAYLKQFPLDVLKIDQSFVREMQTSRSDMAIVHMILGLARELKLAVVAEGVEQESQHQLLAGLGCDYLQGYLISRPVPALALGNFLEQRGCLPRLRSGTGS